jgi:hypothetical protein
MNMGPTDLEAMGSGAMGSEMMGSDAVGLETMGSGAMGSEMMGSETMGSETMGSGVVGSGTMGSGALDPGARRSNQRRRQLKIWPMEGKGLKMQRLAKRSKLVRPMGTAANGQQMTNLLVYGTPARVCTNRL